MKTIVRYELQPNRLQNLQIAAGGQILGVHAKADNIPLLWVLVDPDMPPVDRFIGIYSTNTEVPDDPGRYIGTFFIYEGTLEFHLFEMDGAPPVES